MMDDPATDEEVAKFADLYAGLHVVDRLIARIKADGDEIESMRTHNAAMAKRLVERNGWFPPDVAALAKDALAAEWFDISGMSPEFFLTPQGKQASRVNDAIAAIEAHEVKQNDPPSCGQQAGPVAGSVEDSVARNLSGIDSEIARHNGVLSDHHGKILAMQSRIDGFAETIGEMYERYVAIQKRQTQVEVTVSGLHAAHEQTRERLAAIENSLHSKPEPKEPSVPVSELRDLGHIEIGGYQYVSCWSLDRLIAKAEEAANA
jgi:hypothetical protein